MKRNHIYVGLLVCAMIFVIAWAAYGMLNYGKGEKVYNVSVIVDDSSNDRWSAFREGLEQGADDYGLRVNMVSTGTHSDAGEEYQQIARELDNGAQGLILQVCSGGESAERLEELMTHQALTLVETDVEPEEVFPAVLPDHYEIGKAIAEAVMADEDADGKRIGILAGNQNMLSMEKRLAGFLDTMEESGFSVVWTITADEMTTEDAIGQMLKNEPVDRLVALDNDATEQAVDALLLSEEDEIRLYGEGCSEKAVYYLDQGRIRTLVVPNEFYMGYESVASVARQLQHDAVAAERQIIDFLVVNRENLYDEDTQKILFPIVQ